MAESCTQLNSWQTVLYWCFWVFTHDSNLFSPRWHSILIKNHPGMSESWSEWSGRINPDETKKNVILRPNPMKPVFLILFGLSRGRIPRSKKTGFMVLCLWMTSFLISSGFIRVHKGVRGLLQHTNKISYTKTVGLMSENSKIWVKHWLVWVELSMCTHRVGIATTPVSNTTVTTSGVLQVHWCHGIHLWRRVGHIVVLPHETPDTLWVHVFRDGRERGCRSHRSVVQGSVTVFLYPHFLVKKGNRQEELKTDLVV